MTAVARPAGANSQGGVWDFLSLACATGGPLAAAVRALQMWVEARVTTIEVEAGGRRFTVTGSANCANGVFQVLQVRHGTTDTHECDDLPDDDYNASSTPVNTVLCMT